jgi:hypothetical protein
MTEKLKGRRAVLFDLLWTRRKARADYLASHPEADYNANDVAILANPDQLTRDIRGMSDDSVEYLIAHHTGVHVW